MNHRSDSGQKRPVYLRDRTYCQNLPCLVEYVGDLRSRDIQYSKNSVDFLMMFDPPKVVKSSPTKFDHMYLQLWLIHTSFFDNPPRLFGIAHFNHPKMVKLLQSPVHIGTYILQLRFFEPTQLIFLRLDVTHYAFFFSSSSWPILVDQEFCLISSHLKSPRVPHRWRSRQRRSFCRAETPIFFR